MDQFLNNPNFIFKFAPFNVNTLKLLIKGMLWFGEPKNQNDPYEGEFILENLDEVLTDEKELAIKKEMNPDTHPSRFEDIYKLGGRRNFKHDYSEYLKNILRSCYGISSFSKKYKELLLWTHYANSHKGVCLVFDRKILVKSLQIENMDIEVDKVNYQSNIPRIELESDVNKNLSIDGYSVFRFKYVDFEKEKEIRFIKYFNPKFEEERGIWFDKTALKAVIFGERMPADDRRTIAHIVKSNDKYKDVKLIQSTKNMVTREIKIEPLNGQSYIDVWKDFGANFGLYGDIIHD
ncbi:MAG: DUF2971 domain-containing protein [Bacteroidetes bacterium]|nr:DUF2971 domain-containing protein [Bacteroidota bacterium]